MDFDISEEQELLQETIRQLAENECPLTRVREVFDGDSGHDPDLWKSLVEVGLGGTTIPEEFGGAGLELLDQALAAESLGNAATPGPFLGHSLAGLAVLLGGSDEQKKSWLPRLAMGDVIGTVAFAEEGSAWQPNEWTLRANGTLSGTKKHVPYGSIADVIVVGTADGGLVLVEPAGGGVETEPVDGADRTRRLATVTFDGAAFEILPEGQKASGRVRDAGLILLSADAYGGAARSLEMAVDYANTRQQFGVTIGHFQGIKHQLANMAIKVDPVRFLVWYAAHAFDHLPDESGRTAALTKAHATAVFMQTARDTVEVHGGIGFTWECDVQILFKRAMFDRAFLGAPRVHRERAAVLGGW
ncbi:MAG: acyl-CoA dehydrogenase family protein [Myxococcota bacterium]